MARATELNHCQISASTVKSGKTDFLFQLLATTIQPSFSRESQALFEVLTRWGLLWAVPLAAVKGAPRKSCAPQREHW